MMALHKREESKTDKATPRLPGVPNQRTKVMPIAPKGPPPNVVPGGRKFYYLLFFFV